MNILEACFDYAYNIITPLYQYIYNNNNSKRLKNLQYFLRYCLETSLIHVFAVIGNMHLLKYVQHRNFSSISFWTMQNVTLRIIRGNVIKGHMIIWRS